MLQWLGSYFTSDYEVWLKWQDKQNKSHYVESTCTIQPKVNHNLYLKYCFGDFENLIFTPEQCSEMQYFTLLINTYDQCKGYLRNIKGESAGIALIRNAIKDNNFKELYQYPFTTYPYYELHAHTVAYFSLSTLLLFLASNYSHYKNQNCPHINMELCKKAYQSKKFGEIANPILKSSQIAITQPKQEIRQCHSWPTHELSLKCAHCNRVAERLWGTLQHCLDCHLYKVCVVCGGELFSIGPDNYPRCILHQHFKM